MSPRRTAARTVRARVALLGVLTVGATTLSGADVAVASTATLTVPDRAVITIDGRGFGHGHGLSQYGAEGAARQGLTAGQILHFYYPHTTTGHRGGHVTVLITENIGQGTTIVARPGLEVHDLSTGTTTPVPSRGPASLATRWRMSGDGTGGTAVSYRTDSWHVWRTLPGNGEFRSTGRRLTLVLGSGRVTYRGTLRSMAPISKATHRITVNMVSLEGYVRGVVPREMPSAWHRAALRAQAVAARTYAAFETVDPSDPRFNLCDSTSCQVYGGASGEDPRTNKAVARTSGQVRLYHGEPAFTQFSASDGGWTADGGQPYLVAQKDPYDGWSGNLVHRWTTSVTSRSIEKAWPVLGNLVSITVDLRDGNGQWGGRVVDLTLHGSKGDVKQLSGDDFRGALGLRSSWFDLAKASAG
jgi:stage II sporulation protein D